ncbi:hypothetical protein ES703_08338 [subsurface metagenome]
MAWTAVADVPFVPVSSLYFSQIIGGEFYVIDRGFNFWKCNIGTGVWTQLANPPYIGTNIHRPLTHRNGMLYCVDEGGAAMPIGRRISWYNIATGLWASSSQVPFAATGYRSIRGFCFADDDTIWAWLRHNVAKRMKCVRLVISTDTWTEFANNTGDLAVAQARSAAINAAGTIVYCGEQGAAAGCYGQYTIGGDAYAQSSPFTGVNYSWAHDPQRLWFHEVGGPIANRRYGYFDIEALVYNDDYWPAGPPTRTSMSYMASDLQAIVSLTLALAGPNPWVWWNGQIVQVPTVQTDPATEIT